VTLNFEVLSIKTAANFDIKMWERYFLKRNTFLEYSSKYNEFKYLFIKNKSVLALFKY